MASFVLLLVLLLSNQKLVYSVANVALHPSIVAAGQGQSFVVNITMSSVSRLYGWELKLNWTSSYLDVVSVSEGPFLKTGGDTFFTSRVNNTEGHLIVDCTLLGTIPGVTGEGVLTSATFHVKTAGQCLLDLYYVSLLDDSLDPQSIPCETSDGYWSSLPGDVVSPFGVVDMKDVAYVAKRFGTNPSSPLWDPIADFDSSGKVDMKDIAVVARNFGMHDP